MSYAKRPNSRADLHTPPSHAESQPSAVAITDTLSLALANAAAFPASTPTAPESPAIELRLNLTQLQATEILIQGNSIVFFPNKLKF